MVEVLLERPVDEKLPVEDRPASAVGHPCHAVEKFLVESGQIGATVVRVGGRKYDEIG